MLKNKKGKKLRYKGLIVVVLGIGYIEVEAIARLLQESTVYVSEEVCPLAKTKVIGKVGRMNLVFYGKNQFHTMV